MSSASKSQSKTDSIPNNGSAAAINKSAPPPIQPIQDIKSLLLDSLGARWNVFVEQASKSRERPTEKAIHDLRVAMRRVIALLEMIKPITARTSRAVVLKQLKNHLKSLSTLRDVQVQILLTRKLSTDFPIMSSFLATMSAGEKAAMKQARREIGRIDMDTLGKKLQDLKQSLDRYLSEKFMLEMAQSIVRGELSKSFAQTIYLRSEILHDTTGNDTLIHELRIAFKDFRYMVEVLRPTLPRITIRSMKAMNRFQLRMGDIQDTDVLIAGLDRYVAKIRKIERPLFAPVRGFLGKVRNDRVNEFMTTMDELYKFWERVR